MTPDVNVLVAASHAQHVGHVTARDWLRMSLGKAAVGERLLLFPMVAASFVRVATHPKVFESPLTATQAFAFIDALLASPGVSMPALGEEWPRLRTICLKGKLRSNDVPDAWLAAAVQEAGDHLATFDADFQRLLRRDEMTLLRTSAR